MIKKTKIVLPLLVAVMAFSGCGSVSDSASTSTMNTASLDSGYGYSLNSVDRDAEADTLTESVSDEAISGSAVASPMTAEAEVEKAEVQVDKGTSHTKGTERNSKRKLIRNKTLTVETKNLDKTLEKVNTAIDAFNAYVESSTTDNPSYDGSHRICYMTIRVPQDKLDAFTNQVDATGTVTNATESTEDVTLQYTDVEAHKRALDTEYEKVMELLGQAKTMDQILMLESKLSDLRYQIDSYESQLRVLDDEVTYSTVSLTLEEVEYEKDVDKGLGTRVANGFKDGLHNLKEFGGDFLVGFVTALPFLLVFGLVAATIVPVVMVILKKTRNRRLRKRVERAQSLSQGNTPRGISPSGKDRVFNQDKDTGNKDTEVDDSK